MRISATNINCEGAGCPSLNTAVEGVTIVGSGSMGEALMPLLLQGFAANQDAVVDTKEQGGTMEATVIGEAGFGDELAKYILRPSSSTEGFRDLRDDSVEINMSSRRILPAEARSLRDAGAGNMIDVGQEHIVAVDSISVIVHPNNPIQSISLQNLDLIYSGNITNWAEIGGPSAPITVYGRETGSGTAAVFEEKIFSASGRSKSNFVRSVDNDQEVSRLVNADPGAIGYVGSAFVRGAKPLDIQASCGITTSPTSFLAKTEEYPLQRRLYLYNRADNLSFEGQDLIDFAISSEADSLVAKAGFVDLGVRRLAMDSAGSRMRDLIQSTNDPFELGLMREMLVDMFQWDRLSTTFRFSSGSSRLDGKAQVDLQRLVTYLQTQPEGTEVAFVGFTDSDGAFEANRALSVGRAQQVAETIQIFAGPQLGKIEFTAKGYGEMAPVACNDTLDGKRINRRVEVWVRKP
nr:phosphate ABC transporter substrate-binding/OmpA family protein [Pseudaestuariivita rosea]